MELIIPKEINEDFLKLEEKLKMEFNCWAQYSRGYMQKAAGSYSSDYDVFPLYLISALTKSGVGKTFGKLSDIPKDIKFYHPYFDLRFRIDQKEYLKTAEELIHTCSKMHGLVVEKIKDESHMYHYNLINPTIKFEIKRHPFAQKIDQDILKLLVKVIGVKEIQLSRSNYLFDHFKIKIDFGKGKFSVDNFLDKAMAISSLREELAKMNLEIFKLEFHDELELGIKYL
jgi:hypothetical protein